MERLVESLGVTSLSKSQVSEMAKELDEAVEAFRTRPLDAGPYTFVAADALVLKVRENGRAVAQSNWTYYDCPRPDSETVAQCRLALGVVPDGERVRGIDTQTGRTRPILAIRVLERGLDRVPHARSLASPLGAAAAAISASHAVSADGHNSCSMQIGSASYYSSSTASEQLSPQTPSIPTAGSTSKPPVDLLGDRVGRFRAGDAYHSRYDHIRANFKRAVRRSQAIGPTECACRASFALQQPGC